MTDFATPQTPFVAEHGEVVPGTNLQEASVQVIDKYAMSNTWSKAKEFKKPFDYHLENSDQTVLVHRLDMGDLLKLGVADEMDFMSKALISADVKPGEDQKSNEAVADVVKKASNFSKMEKMINAVVLAGMIKPKLYAVPEHENARQAGLVYVDEIPWDDRMELFSVIFETEGLSTFREEQETGVGDVEHVASVPLSTDGPVDIRPNDA
jgi:hypothetical protein